MSFLIGATPSAIAHCKLRIPVSLTPNITRAPWRRSHEAPSRKESRVYSKSVNHSPSERPKWERLLSTATSLYPLYVTTGGIIACVNPFAFSWFVERAPASYSFSLGLIMLAMGLTLELKDLLVLFYLRPLSILFGCVSQYTIMPALGFLVSRWLHLPPALSAGLILLSCCPGGTASNVVTLIAQGDVPLSIVMTICTTLGAAFVTPLLTKTLAGTYVPVDALKLSVSTMQVVVAPILIGSCIQTKFPKFVKGVLPLAPFLAVLTSSLLASSVFSENVIRLKSSTIPSSLSVSSSTFERIQPLISGELGPVLLAVLLLHCAGFFVGYFAASICGFAERERRAISIEVGMQNSSLGVVLAAAHFSSPAVSLPPAISAVVMNVIGSCLGLIWRYNDPNRTANGDLERNA